MKLTRLAVLLVMAACSRHEVSLNGRSCDGTSCFDGYACFNSVCQAVDDSGPAAGASCATTGSVASCDAAVGDCSHGCKQCDGTAWGACAFDCAVIAPELVQPETCDGVDNDCDGVIDQSGAAGCVQRFLDHDGDGYGTGASRCACALDPDSYTATVDGDCDDTNADVHPSAKDVCNDCAARVFALVDHDGDGLSRCDGDCDDSRNDVHPGAPETVLAGTCVDGVDNDCNGVKDCAEAQCVWAGSGYKYARVITVTRNPTLSVGAGIAVTFDHAGLIVSGHAVSTDGADVRVFYNDSGTYHEIARQLDLSTAWNTATTTIWFAAQAALTTPSTDYLVVYGVASSVLMAPSTDTGIFSVYERLNGPNGPLGAPWTVTGDGVNYDDTQGGYARMYTANNLKDNPTMSVSFPPLAGRVVLTIGTRYVGDEGTYAQWMHIGHDLPNPTDAPSTASSAAVFAWGKHSGFGPYINSGEPRHYTAVTGVSTKTFTDFGGFADDTVPEHKLTARIDFKAGTVQSQLDGNAAVALGLTDTSVTSVNQVQFVNWECGSLVAAVYRYVMVRAAPENDPAVTIGSEVAVGPCE